MKNIVVAIDGFSSCGKSTMAKWLAKEVGYKYIDSGAMYRAVTLFCLRNNLIKDGVVDTEKLEKRMNEVKIEFRVNENTGKSDTYLNGECVESEIRGMDVFQNIIE